MAFFDGCYFRFFWRNDDVTFFPVVLVYTCTVSVDSFVSYVTSFRCEGNEGGLPFCFVCMYLERGCAF